MAPSTRLLAAACLLALTARPATAASQAQASRWWKSEAVIAELALTSEQSAKIDQIWESTLPELREEWDQLDHLEEKLTRMIEGNTDEASLGRQIDRVETARANAAKTRTLMLYRMRQVLTPEQRVRLKTIQQRRDRQSPSTPGKSGGAGRNDGGQTDKRRIPEL